MDRSELLPGTPAPVAGRFLVLNIFGTPTGETVLVRERETLPVLPIGFTWKPLAAYSVEELRERAGQFRGMAATAATGDVTEGLLRLAAQFDMLAADRAQAPTFDPDSAG